jgi:hypothetical protein
MDRRWARARQSVSRVDRAPQNETVKRSLRVRRNLVLLMALSCSGRLLPTVLSRRLRKVRFIGGEASPLPPSRRRWTGRQHLGRRLARGSLPAWHLSPSCLLVRRLTTRGSKAERREIGGMRRTVVCYSVFSNSGQPNHSVARTVVIPQSPVDRNVAGKSCASIQ